MNQNNKFCSYKGHEQLQVNQVCTYKQCVNRWCCSQCLNDDIHRHSMPNSDHIMNQAQLQNKVKSDIQNLKNECSGGKQVNNLKAFLQQKDKEFKEIEKQLLDNQISDTDNFKLQQLIQLVEGQNFIQLNDEDIDKLLNIDQYQFNYDVSSQTQGIQNIKLDQENINNKIIDFKSREYDIQKIYLMENQNFLSAIISNNEQYLAYGSQIFIYIYDLRKDKVYIKLRQQSLPMTFQFTIDSKILFSGDFQGLVYGYIVTNGFKIFYKQKIHRYSIIQIIVEYQYLITASWDGTIIQTNFTNKNRIFKLVGHSNVIISIDYDILKDIMISTSNDKTLKVWDCLNQSKLIDNYPKDFYQIQLINDKQDILCCNEYGLQKFAIDYQNKKLVEIYHYIDDNQILSFQSINKDQNILLIYSQYYKILNKEGELIVKMYHNINLQKQMHTCYRQQLDNLNYIILQDCKLLYYKQDYCLHILREKYKI